MEQRYNAAKGIDLRLLHEYCNLHGETICYRKGEIFDREGEPARWFGFVEQGCFKYVIHNNKSKRESIAWFSFEGEVVGDFPNMLYNRRAQQTIKAMTPCRVLRISGENLRQFFSQDIETMKLRHLITDHVLTQFQRQHIDHYRSTPPERYKLLLKRCPGIVNDLPLNAIASFLNISTKTLSMIRRDITYGKK